MGCTKAPGGGVRHLDLNSVHVEDLDKTGTIYSCRCKKHPEVEYIGETDRVLRERLYEHRVIDHKTASRAASLCHPNTNAEPRIRLRSTPIRRRRADYHAMHHGLNQQITEGNTEFAAHVASDTHTKEDLIFEVLGTQKNWWKRGVKEAIHIKKNEPNLNQDDGRHHLAPLYTPTIQSSKAIRKSGQGRTDVTN